MVLAPFILRHLHALVAGGAMTKILAAHGTDCETPCSAEKATDHCMFVDVDVLRRNRLECKCRRRLWIFSVGHEQQSQIGNAS